MNFFLFNESLLREASITNPFKNKGFTICNKIFSWKFSPFLEGNRKSATIYKWNGRSCVFFSETALSRVVVTLTEYEI